MRVRKAGLQLLCACVLLACGNDARDAADDEPGADAGFDATADGGATNDADTSDDAESGDGSTADAQSPDSSESDAGDGADTSPDAVDLCDDLDCEAEGRVCEATDDGARCGECLPDRIERDGVCEARECDTAEDCPVPEPTAWSDCGYETVCAELGQQTREVWAATCDAAVCVSERVEESRACERSTQGTEISNTVTECEAPERYPCQYEGTLRRRIVTCQSGELVDTFSDESCIRDTDGLEVDRSDPVCFAGDTPCDFLGASTVYFDVCVDGERDARLQITPDACDFPSERFLRDDPTTLHPDLLRDGRAPWTPCLYEDACSTDGLHARYGLVCSDGELAQGRSTVEYAIRDVDCTRVTDGLSGWHDEFGGCTAMDHRIVACNDDGTLTAERRQCDGGLVVDSVTLDCGFCRLGECVDIEACRIVPPEGFVYVPPGTFTMGCDDETRCEPNEAPAHEVTLTRGLFVSAEELSYAEFLRARRDVSVWEWMDAGGDIRSFVSTEGHPGQLAYAFFLGLPDGSLGYTFQLLNERAGLPNCFATNHVSDGLAEGLAHPADCVGYRPPTEAEWEYFTRAGTTGETYVELDLPAELSCEEQQDAFAEYERLRCGSWGDPPITGGALRPNPLGLYDTLGNPSELVLDASELYAFGEEPETDPWGGPGRVVRGNPFALPVRASARWPVNVLEISVLRPVRTAPPEADPSWEPRRD